MFVYLYLFNLPRERQRIKLLYFIYVLPANKIAPELLTYPRYLIPLMKLRALEKAFMRINLPDISYAREISKIVKIILHMKDISQFSCRWTTLILIWT